MPPLSVTVTGTFMVSEIWELSRASRYRISESRPYSLAVAESSAATSNRAVFSSPGFMSPR